MGTRLPKQEQEQPLGEEVQVASAVAGAQRLKASPQVQPCRSVLCTSAESAQRTRQALYKVAPS